MRKMLRFIVLAFSAVLLFNGTAVAGKTTVIPEEWNMLFEYEDVRDAAKEVCIIFDGAGTWETAEVRTAGISVLAQVDTDETVDLSLFASIAVFSVDEDQKPQKIAGTAYPVRMVFEKAGRGYRLVSYERPEDGTYYGESMRRIFPAEVIDSLSGGKSDAIKREADADALYDAEAYIAFKKGGGVQSVWKEFLMTGSNKDARDAVLGALTGRFPGYPGQAAWFEYGRLYMLSVDGEQTYSGIITCEVWNDHGEQMEYCRFEADGKEIRVLEGKMPSFYE